MSTEYLSYVKYIATFALTFFGYIISVLASVVLHKKKIRNSYWFQKGGKIHELRGLVILQVCAVQG